MARNETQLKLKELIKTSGWPRESLELQLANRASSLKLHASNKDLRRYLKSAFRRNRAPKEQDRNERTLSDIGLLHIQDTLLSNLASQENASKGLSGLTEPFERQDSACYMSDETEHVAKDDLEKARKDTVEMLKMLHSDFVDVVKKGRNHADSVTRNPPRLF